MHRLKIIFALPIVLLVCHGTFGQLKFASAAATPHNSDEKQWKVDVLFSNTLIQKDITAVTLIDAGTGERIITPDIIYYLGSGAGKVDGFEIPSAQLRRGGNYVLALTLIERKADGTFDKINSGTAILGIPSTKPIPDPAPAAQPLKQVLTTAKSKEKKDSDVYIAGEFVGARKSRPIYSLDVKIAPRFGPGKTDYSPFFTFNGSTDPDADPDSVSFGLSLARSFPREYDAHDKWGLRVTSYLLSGGAKFEAEKDFDNVNLTFNPNLDFVISTIPVGKRSTLTLTPYIGAEVGKNLKSPLAAAQGDGIARLLGGAHVLLDIPMKKIEGITFSADYVRRVLFSNELRYKANDDHTLSLVEYGKSPRQYFESKLEVSLNKFLNPYIAYDFGELPPSFKFVNHRVKAGFSYKFKLTNK
jgi:hypothetical protein